ncbi:Gamma-glutamyltranspeptidase 2 [Thelohanellus kitauei]|uniref:Gamma-glutamyltranspeptidase 2 n=1 Tax=Thelohanellus kitauei TaxID=669202 RepID=A0A0C2M4D5_THEKT|nr:Gamma-glutamyltranspeptidase 2 [Thelohanellus kitauei]
MGLGRKEIISPLLLLLIIQNILLNSLSVAGRRKQPAFSNPKLKEEYKNDVRSYSLGAVTSDSHICSEIGGGILRLGGNAVDAAISTEFCLYVTDVQATGLGGGGKMMIYSKRENKVYFLNFRETSPILTSKIPKDINFRRGPLSIGIPGNVLGLYTAWKKFGSLKWKFLIRPAIVLAIRGFKMSKHLYMCTKNVAKYIRKDRALRRTLMRRKKIKRPGELIKNRALGRTLKKISIDPMSFYRGKVADDIVRDIKKAGGILTKEDLTSFRVTWEKPLSFKVGSGLVGYVPGANSGGPQVKYIIDTLKTLKYSFLKGKSIDPNRFYQKILDVFKLSFAERTRIAKKNPFKIKNFLKLPAITSDRRTTNSAHSAIQSDRFVKYEHGTSHLNTFDRFGNAVALTSSINTQLGSMIMSPKTGILFNNQMSDFNKQGNKKYQLPPVEGNEARPKSEPLSSMCPLIVVDKNKNVKMVSGGSGGPLIITTLAQILINRFWLGLPYDETISRWRIHHQDIPNRDSTSNIYRTTSKQVRNVFMIAYKFQLHENDIFNQLVTRTVKKSDTTKIIKSMKRILD